ncbi:MAG: IclR family transcriptional regulator [Lacisediminihabitans sp.]
MATGNRYAIESVTRAANLFRAVIERRSLSLEEAVEVTGTTKSTAFRLLSTLLDVGLVERARGGGYQPGPEAVRLGLLLTGQLNVATAAAGPLREFWLETKETVALALLTGTSLVLAEVLESPSPFRMAETLGIRVPLHSSALGKAVSAHLPRGQLRDQLGREPYPVITPSSPLRFVELEPRLDLVIRDGFALDVEESALGVACAAAPIFLRGQVAGAVSVAGPQLRMTRERIADLGAQIAEVAARISSRLSLETQTPSGAEPPSGTRQTMEEDLSLSVGRG